MIDEAQFEMPSNYFLYLFISYKVANYINLRPHIFLRDQMIDLFVLYNDEVKDNIFFRTLINFYFCFPKKR